MRKPYYFTLLLIVILFLFSAVAMASDQDALGVIMQKWAGYPCTNRISIDFDGDGLFDFISVGIIDPVPPASLGAVVLAKFDDVIWAVIESRGGAWKIVWLDPDAPVLWIKWLKDEVTLPSRRETGEINI